MLSTPSKQACRHAKHAKHVSMQARKHAKHARTQARQARNLADSFKCNTSNDTEHSLQLHQLH